MAVVPEFKKKKLVDNWSSQNVHFTGLNHITGITGQQINRHVKKLCQQVIK